MGHYDANGCWVEDTMVATEPVSLPQPTPTTEPTIEEHAMSIRTAFDFIMSKAVEGTELAKEIATLRARVQTLEEERGAYYKTIEAECEAHEATKKSLDAAWAENGRLTNDNFELQRRLQDVKNELSVERNLLVDAQHECATAKAAAKQWEDTAQNEAHNADVQRERAEQMAQQVNALRNAFQGLKVL